MSKRPMIALFKQYCLQESPLDAVHSLTPPQVALSAESFGAESDSLLRSVRSHFRRLSERVVAESLSFACFRRFHLGIWAALVTASFRY